MEPGQIDGVDKLADDVCEKVDELDSKGHFAELKARLKALCVSLKDDFSVEVNISVDIFNAQKEKQITLVKTGIICAGGSEPHRATSGSTLHRYIVNGNIVKLPHEYCPHCWGEWDFKLMHPECPFCGVVMGKEVKLLLDTDVCPNCEDGKVSRGNPKCDQCRAVVDSKMVNWG